MEGLEKDLCKGIVTTNKNNTKEYAILLAGKVAGVYLPRLKFHSGEEGIGKTTLLLLSESQWVGVVKVLHNQESEKGRKPKTGEIGSSSRSVACTRSTLDYLLSLMKYLYLPLTRWKMKSQTQMKIR